MKRMLVTMNVSALVYLLLAVISPATAKSFDVGGNTLNMLGYISQTVQVSTAGDHWNNQKGFNQALTTVFVEGDYRPSGNVGFYMGVGLTGDWAYLIHKDGDDWQRKQFDKSDELALNDEWWTILKEAHITWSPGDFFIRVGKQRVSWGEMDVFAVNDVIHPSDFRRGLAEVEIESLVIPIPLVRMDYSIPLSLGFLQNLVAQFVFNPNVDFIPDNGDAFGNDAAGIWALDHPYYDFVQAPLLGLIDRFSLGFAANLIDPSGTLNAIFQSLLPTAFESRLGRADLVLEEPDAFDSDFFEYGFRLSSMVGTSLFSIMGFYGRENTPVTTPGEAFGADSFTQMDDEGRRIVTTVDRGYFPRQKFLGAAWAGALPLRISALGGVEPILRLEARYQFDKEFLDFNQWATEFILLGQSNLKSNIVESDYFVGGINLEFKIKAPWQRTYFTFLCEANYNDFLGWDENWGLENLGMENSWWNYFVVVQTGYFRSKLIPSIVWFNQGDGDVQSLTPGIQYIYNTNFSFQIKGNIFFGSKSIGALKPPLYNHKDNVLFKVTYQWG